MSYYDHMDPTALRLVLSTIDDNQPAFDAMLDDLCPGCIRGLVGDLAALAANWLAAGLHEPGTPYSAGWSAATDYVARHLVEQLDGKASS